MAKIGHIQAHLRTDTGLVRELNQDFVAFWEPTDLATAQQNGWLYLVADGVGGADAGEVASQFASQQLLHHFLSTDNEPDMGQRLINAMQAANTDLRQLIAEKENKSRMATTMVTAVIYENQVFIGNVGDSRGYHWRNGLFQQVTKDQSLVAKLVEEGAITPAEAESHPRKNVILYSLGSERHPQIDLFTIPLLPGDIILLCSDGLTRHVSDSEIGHILGQYAPEEATQLLIEQARERGGEDNISAVVIQVGATAVVPKPTSSPSNRPFLWLYTGFLAFLMSCLILFAWLVLHV